jgi:hypothetical protein
LDGAKVRIEPANGLILLRRELPASTKCNFEAVVSWLLTIEGKQKPCQYDNQLTPSPFLIIGEGLWVIGKGL